MQALIATGRSEALVTLGEAERPRPRPGEVLIKVEAFSVNRGEMFLLEDRGPGWRPGKDIADVVVQAAADSDALASGQRVTGHAEEGGWAQYVTVPGVRSASWRMFGSAPVTQANSRSFTQWRSQ